MYTIFSFFFSLLSDLSYQKAIQKKKKNELKFTQLHLRHTAHHGLTGLGCISTSLHACSQVPLTSDFYIMDHASLNTRQ